MASLTHDLKHVLAVALRRPDSDADLLGRFAASRDESAFAEIVHRHGPAVLRVCRNLLSRVDADDAFQATFFVLARRADSLGDIKSLGGWLVGVAGRVARQLRKDGWRRAAIERQFRPHDSANEKTDQNLKELSEELTRLPMRLRDPVVLCYLEAKTQDEAAAELGQSVRTLRRRIEKAKRVLRLRLERRGVAPAVLAVSSPLWIPSDAAARTAANAVQFLAGGVRTPAATLAKGIGMGSLLKLKVVAGLCVVAGALTAVGVAQNGQKPEVLSKLPKAEIRPQPVLPPAGTAPRPHREGVVLRSSTNEYFGEETARGVTVSAASPTIVRTIRNEAEHQLDDLANTWFGDSPSKLPYRLFIDVKLTDSPNGITVKDFDNDDNLKVARTKLSGPLEPMLCDQLPFEIAHVVLAAHFGPNLPRWADDGMALMATSPEHQAKSDAAVRQMLNEGKGIKFKFLFAMKEYPKAKSDWSATVAQSASVVRFLLYSTPNGFGPPVMSRIPYLHRLFVAKIGDPAKEMIRFVRLGMEKDWGTAVKEVYGFESLDALEDSWIKWLSTPVGRISLQAVAPTQSAPVAPEPDRIPPVNLGK